jgi:hypothetical protein
MLNDTCKKTVLTLCKNRYGFSRNDLFLLATHFDLFYYFRIQ